MPSTTPWTRSPLPALGAVALLALTGCGDDAGDGGQSPDGTPSSSSAAAPTDGESSTGSGGGPGESSSPAGSEEPSATGEAGDEATFTSAEGTYSWQVPSGLTLDEDTAEQPRVWADGEPSQRYPITSSTGLIYGDIVINTATDAGGPPAMHRELLDSRQLEDASQGETETWAQSLLYSNCLTGAQMVPPEESDSSGSPSGPEDCEYRIVMSLVSVEPEQDLEDSGVWAFFHHTPEERAGNVIMNATLPPHPEGGDPTWLSREDAEGLTGTPEYQQLWKLFTSFEIHEDAVEGPEESPSGDAGSASPSESQDETADDG